MCRPGQIASFPLNMAISQSGLVAAFDFYPYPPPHGSNEQAIFTIRNTATDFVSLRCVYFQNTATLNLVINEAGTESYPLDPSTASSIPIQSGKYETFFVIEF